MIRGSVGALSDPTAAPAAPAESPASSVTARTSAVVRAAGVLGELRCQPPLTLRQVTAAPGWCGLCLVGTTAGPLAGDAHRLDLLLEPGARASLSAAGASIAQGRGGRPAHVTHRAELGAGARLVADPGPLVVCQDSAVTVRVELALASDASLEWRELIVLGRTMDAVAGRAWVRWDLVRDGRAVLRHAVELPASLAACRVLAGALISGPEVVARTVVAGPFAAAQRIDPVTALITVLADDAASALRARDQLIATQQAGDEGAGRDAGATQRLPASGPHLASTTPSRIAATE